MPFDTDSDFEISGESLTDDELREIRRWRGDDTYTPARGVDPLQDRCTDTQICLLSPFLKLKQPLDPSALQAILDQHPVRVARPGRSYDRFAIETLISYCSQEGGDWAALKTEAERLLARLPVETHGQQPGR